ncbi:hypothetical protein MO867_21640, partial [Microbulbifer sp. OS29]
VITVAALSLATWSSGAEAAERRAESLLGKISQLERKYKDLNLAQREGIELEISEEKRSLRRKVASLVERRANLQYGAVNSNDGIRRVDNSRQITIINKQIADLNKTLQEAEERLANLGKPKALTDDGEPLSLAPVGGGPDNNSSSVRDDLPALEQALQEQFERTAQSRLDTVENLRQSLLTEEEALAESYRRRNRIIEENVHDPAKREELLEQNRDQFNEEIDTRLQGLRESWLSEQEILLLRQDEEMEILDQGYISKREALAVHLEAVRADEEDSRQAILSLEGEYQRNLTSLEEKHRKQRKKMEDAANKSQLTSTFSTFNSMLGIAAAFSPKLFKIQQKLALAKALVTLPAAVIESFDNAGGYPTGIPAAAAMAATGAAEIAQLKSVSFGSSGSASTGVAGSTSAGSLTSPASPLASSDSISTESEEQTGTQVIFQIAGDVNGDNAEKLLEQIEEMINEQDVVFINPNSRQAQELSG